MNEVEIVMAWGEYGRMAIRCSQRNWRSRLYRKYMTQYDVRKCTQNI